MLAESWTCAVKCIRFDADKLLVGGSADASLWLLLAAYGMLVAGASVGGRLATWLDAETGPRLTSFGQGVRWGAAACGFVLSLLLSPGGEAPPFIYFQF